MAQALLVLPSTVGSWTARDERIASARLAMTDRAGRWVTEAIGRWGRTVNEIAVELGCDWHTINDTPPIHWFERCAWGARVTFRRGPRRSSTG